MEALPPSRRGRRIWLWAALIAIPIVVGSLICWWLTAPLDVETAPPAASPRSTPPPPVVVAPPIASGPAPWPLKPMDGEPAKRYLLDYLEAAEARLKGISGYTATFRKQERMRGKLGAEQTLEMKARHQPFSIYLKYLSPTPGREILYVDGKHDNKVIAHSNDFAGMLVPRLPVDPKSPLALADNRHPVTEAGLANLTSRLVGFRKLDLKNSEATTTLDRVVDEQGRTWFRSFHDHKTRSADRPFQKVEVLYDPKTNLPYRISSYDWVDPAGSAEPPLAEKYTYENLKLDPPPTDLDFDLSNPAYSFRRF